MTQVHIVNRIQTDFGMVPRALWQMRLPANAKLCAAYLFCLRDGSAPYVAQIEHETGLGRDARRKAFAALEAAGVIEWDIQRDASQRVVSKSLVIDYAPVLASVAALAAHEGESRAPENQADGKASRAPNIPADGKPVPVGAETRPCSDGKSGDKRKEKETRAANARKAVGSGPSRRLAAWPSERPAATSAKPGRSAASRAQAAVSDSAGDSRLNGKRREYLGPDGVWYPEPRDNEEAERFHQWRQASQAVRRG